MESTEIKQEPAWEGMSREQRQEVLDQYQDMEIGSSDDNTWWGRAWWRKQCVSRVPSNMSEIVYDLLWVWSQNWGPEWTLY